MTTLIRMLGSCCAILAVGSVQFVHGDTPEAATVIDVLASAKRVLWLAAHPDDETSAGALLARVKDVSGTLFMATLTKGENSDKVWGGLKRGTAMGEARAALFEKSAALLQADGVEIGPFVNGPHALDALDAMPAKAPHRDWPEKSTSDDVIAKWSQEADPVQYIVSLLRQKRPDAVVSMDDHCGVSGHDEHIAVARLLLRAIPQAADAAAYPEAGEPWQVQHAIFTAQVLPQLVACRYCKCEGEKPAGPAQDVFNLDASRVHGMTYLGVQCLVARQYQSVMETKKATTAQMLAGCQTAQAAAKRAFRPGQKGQPFFQSFRIRSLSE